jgi:hypothetical protein
LLAGLPSKQTSKSLRVGLRPDPTQKQIAQIQAHLDNAIGKQFDLTVTG